MVENLDAKVLFWVLGFPINATLVYTWVVMGILGLGSFILTRSLKAEGPLSKPQVALEMLVMGIRRQIKEVSLDNPARYLKGIGTFFLFIALSNLLTIIPGFKAPTSSLSTTAAFAFCVFVAMPIYGIQNAGVKGYLKKYVEPTPLMIPLNILSDFSSVFALAFRLYGNMLGGAVAGTVLLNLAPFLLPVPMQLLGQITGLIQAYIFALLGVVYVSSVGPSQSFEDPLDM